MSVLRTISSAQVLDALGDLKDLAGRVAVAAARCQQYHDLAGLDPPSVYWRAHRLIQRAVAALRAADHEVLTMRAHQDDWNEEDYCRVCGADGRA